MRAPGVVAALCGLPFLLGGTALADAPTRTGWWNAATVNGAALPQPTTGADDLHVSQGPDGPAAYAALAFDHTQGVTGGVLTLTVVDGSAVGTVDVQACPTKDLTWKAGGNQPYGTRPQYDCASGAQGVAAADGNALVFVLDAAQQLAGAYSLALVPTEGAAPFSVDFAKPGSTALVPAAPAAPAEEPTVDEPPPAAPAPATAPLAPTTFEAPPVQVGGSPVLAPALPAPAPVAAAAPVAPVTVLPVAARPPVPMSNRDRYAAGTMLALLAGALVWAFQQPARAPQLIGGGARRGSPSPSVPVAADAQPRGIGRFATVRTAPARRLV